MPKLLAFYKRHNDKTFNIRTKNNIKLMEGFTIASFFEVIAQDYKNKRLPSFEDFYVDITLNWLLEFKNNEPYEYKDWSERSRKEFRRISREFYVSLI